MVLRESQMWTFAEMADGIRNGIIPDEKPIKCYVHCCLELTGMVCCEYRNSLQSSSLSIRFVQQMKKNKINYDATIKQIDLLMPDDIKDPYKNALGMCKDSGVGIKDNCDAAYAILKCLMKEYPEMLFP